MLIFALTCLCLFLCAIGYILWQRQQYRQSYDKLNKLIIDAIKGNTDMIDYDETTLSALADKLLRYINTNKKRLSSIQDERNTIKTLISDISHQTKTPIANILLYSGLLQENNNLDAKTIELAESIQSQSQKLSFLIGALVKMSRLESGIISIHAQVQLLKPLISGAVSDVYPRLEEKNISLEVSCPEDAQAKFDAKWTKEALHNILENAVKYTPAGGKITIHTISYDMFVRMDVTDNGIGIDSTEFADIFKRFYRSSGNSDQDGIGVGLYLAREIITMQGGYIQVASTLGQGSSFSIFLLQK